MTSMGSALGMDIDQVNNLSLSMRTNADNIQQATSQLTSQIDSTTWNGSDNQKFRNDWDSVYSVQLRNIIDALHERDTHLQNEIQQQHEASGS